MTRLPGAVESERLTTPERTVWKIDAVPCQVGQVFTLAFESDDGRWRHGVRLMVDGLLSAGEAEADQVVLWTDTAAELVRLTVRARLMACCACTTSGTPGAVGASSHRQQPAECSGRTPPKVGGIGAATSPRSRLSTPSRSV